MSNETFGIGTRVKHPAFGEGAIIYVDIAAYKVCFMQFGIKHVGKDYAGWEIIEKIESSEEVSFSAAEKSLIKILRTYNGIDEEVKLGDITKLININLSNREHLKYNFLIGRNLVRGDFVVDVSQSHMTGD